MTDQQNLFDQWPESDWTDVELTIWREIQNRYGSENAISAKKIAEKHQMAERSVRKTAKHLIEFHHLPIMSTCAPPYGYFRPWGAEEVNECARWLMSAAKSILVRASAIRKNSNIEKMIGQLDLELELKNEP